MDRDLIALTDALGVNPHSYMVNELAKCIQRDSVAFQMKTNTETMIGEFMASLAESAKD